MSWCELCETSELIDERGDGEGLPQWSSNGRCNGSRSSTSPTSNGGLHKQFGSVRSAQSTIRQQQQNIPFLDDRRAVLLSDPENSTAHLLLGKMSWHELRETSELIDEVMVRVFHSGAFMAVAIDQGLPPPQQAMEDFINNLAVYGQLNQQFGQQRQNIPFLDDRRAVLLSGSYVRCMDRAMHHCGPDNYQYRVGRITITAIATIRRNVQLFNVPLTSDGFDHEWVLTNVNEHG